MNILKWFPYYSRKDVKFLRSKTNLLPNIPRCHLRLFSQSSGLFSINTKNKHYRLYHSLPAQTLHENTNPITPNNYLIYTTHSVFLNDYKPD